MQSANPKQIKVFRDKGSLKQSHDIIVNTIAPIENPNKREGHSCPSKYNTKCFTDCKYNNDKGTPIKDIINGFSFTHSYLN
jgi:hypothetical protein